MRCLNQEYRKGYVDFAWQSLREVWLLRLSNLFWALGACIWEFPKIGTRIWYPKFKEPYYKDPKIRFPSFWETPICSHAQTHLPCEHMNPLPTQAQAQSAKMWKSAKSRMPLGCRGFAEITISNPHNSIGI